MASATSVVPTVLSPAVALTSSVATYITGAAGAATQTIIKRAVVTNITAGPITFDLWRVASGGSVANGDLVMKTRSVAATDTYTCPELANMVLLAGDTIQIQASANTSLNFTASGYVVS